MRKSRKLIHLALCRGATFWRESWDMRIDFQRHAGEIRSWTTNRAEDSDRGPRLCALS